MGSTSNLQRIKTIFQWLDRNAELYLIGTLYIYIITIIGIEVFRRFVLNQSSVWGEEIARMMFIYLTWIGVSWGVYKRVHIRIDVLHQRLSEKFTGILYILGDLSILIFSYYAITLSIPVIQNALSYGATTAALRVNRAYFLIAIPLGFSLVVIRTLQALHQDVQNVRHGNPVEKGDSLFELDEEDSTTDTGALASEVDNGV